MGMVMSFPKIVDGRAGLRIKERALLAVGVVIRPEYSVMPDWRIVKNGVLPHGERQGGRERPVIKGRMERTVSEVVGWS